MENCSRLCKDCTHDVCKLDCNLHNVSEENSRRYFRTDIRDSKLVKRVQ